DFAPLALLALLAAVSSQRLREAAHRIGAGLERAAGPGAGKQSLQHALQQLGITPEQGKGLIEQRLLLAAVDEYGGERGVQGGAVGDADRVHRAQRLQDAVGADGQASAAQQAAKV